MKIKIKRLNHKAVIPAKAHATDAGFDLVATSRTVDNNGNIVYGTGLAFEIPEGHVGYIFPRSSISQKDVMLTNAVGVIDAGYRGEVTFKFKANNKVWRYDSSRYGETFCRELGSNYMDIYNVGDRIGQLIIMPIPDIEFEEAEELSTTDRGTGGYGSTGK